MKTTLLSLTGAVLLTGLVGCGQEQDAPISNASVEADRIKAHMTFLADDTLKGRDTGSEGYQIAANYVVSQFKQIGVEPKGDHGSYEQQVTFRKAFLEKDTAKVSITNSNGSIALVEGEGFIAGGSTARAETNLSGETVFVGYGIVSEQFGLNDYEGLDVEGKIVVALSGRPEDIPSEEGAVLGSSSIKYQAAADAGAIGFVTIHTPKREKVRSFKVSSRFAYGPRYTWVDKTGKTANTYGDIRGGAYLSHEAAVALFEGAQMSAEEVFALDEENKAVKGFALNASIAIESKSRHEEITSPNVVGVIEGSDPVLKDEYVVFSAHLDHIGVSTHGDHEDKINNGALDNASGVSTLLETARVFSAMDVKPKRSILFVVVTGEEKGLLGSSYFARNPTVPQVQMVGNVNLDMPLLLYPFADVVAFGATHSTLGPIVEKAAGKINIGLSPDPMPEQSLFVRSDHYSFVKEGIPSVFLMTGFKSQDPEIDGGEVFRDFLKNHYHQHSDELDLPINYDAAARFAEVNFMIGLEIANGDERPQWNQDDFFGKTFAQ
ncbi:M28 family metallopeptidase [Thalassotalea agarivorans]|uniref:Zn-dependent amino-or carboxypeptidase, M28 family n=1 Tax=Thalassotalea agarivorans TaxID=349064 RepID=A0A1H9YC90_THASX|nr:M28 family metallopeptidase [Thalassotalea agarivorans]SES66158.1 Zn-dependent amino-or carboxypeptidase, M28 family [Thalassotalea agarivorans]